VVVVSLLVLDLGVFHRRAHVITMREAVRWSIFWIALALLFNAWVYYMQGKEPATQFLTGFILEKSLSVDNLFVISVIFTYFRVPAAYQHRVLFWGILGALITRGVFIGVGVELINHFHWVTYVMGAFLVWTGIKLLRPEDEDDEPGNNAVVRFAQRQLRFTKEYDGQKFLTRVGGTLMATPLMMVLIVVETTDVIFAVDSIPAVLAITTDPFVVYTSNVFAILGLRALYFVLADAVLRFHFMKQGLCFILSFVGLKMLAAPFYKLPTEISLGIILGALLVTAVMSIGLERRLDEARAEWLKVHGGHEVDRLPAMEVVLPLPGAPPSPVVEAGEVSAVEKLMFLRSIATFQGVALEELGQLADDLILQQYKAGETFFLQGEKGDALYVLVDGEVGIDQADDEGKVLRIATLGPRQYFGEMALFDGAPRSATATAVKDTILLALAREPFLRVGTRHPRILLEVIRVLSERLRVADAALARGRI